MWLLQILGGFGLLILGSHVVGHVCVGVAKVAHVGRGQLLVDEAPRRGQLEFIRRLHCLLVYILIQHIVRMHGWVRRMKLNQLWLLCERGSRKLSNVQWSVVDEAVLLARAAYVNVWAGATLLKVVQVLSTVALAGHSFEIEHSLAFMRRVPNGVVFHRCHVVEMRRCWGLKSVWGDWSIV